MGQGNAATPSGQKTPTKSRGRDKPDPRPARLMLGAGALSSVTVVGGGLVDFPPAVAEDPGPTPT